MVSSFLTQSARVFRPGQSSSDVDGQPLVVWEEVSTDTPCRLMHDAASVAGQAAGSVQRPRCYFDIDADVTANDEVEVEGVRYALDQFFGPAEGGTHYQVATLRSELRG